MFKSKTVFIVGAGASAEVGLPVGSALKSDIANILQIEEAPGYCQRFLITAFHKCLRTI